MPTDDYAGNSATTGQIFMGSSVTGSIETAYDQDWFAFTLMGGNTYIFTVECLPSSQGGLSDPVLRLINTTNGIVSISTGESSNAIVGASGHSTTTLTYNAPNLEWHPSYASGTYFISVLAYYGWHSTGTYRLSMVPSASDLITGTSGSDTLLGGAGNDTIDGGTGIDTASYAGNRASFTVTQSGTGFIVTDSTGTLGTDTLTGIERLQFADTNLALDLDGNAGTTAKILGAVFGQSSLSNKAYVGIGLSYLDGGMSYADLMALAINAAGATTNNAVIDLLWTNLFGTAPTTTEAASYVAMLDNGSHTAGTLGVLAADTSYNTTNIDLVGLAQMGIEFI